MNPLILISLLLFFSTASAQQINQENGPSFLIGQINIEGLSSKSYQSWYSNNHKAYQVDKEIIASIKAKLAKHQILLFMGTWCGDSKREVPRFIKILEAADFLMEHLKTLALDRRIEKYKTSPNAEEWALQIKRVPTFIFYKNGKETNRIIESPIISLEADIKTIVTNAEYTPNYPKSLHFD
jgi:thiol-disulfide isomerase/thioredoxin